MKYKNLVLSGGGVRGIYYIALLKYFENNNININDFKNLAGVSVGSFFATAISLGYTSDELEEHALYILDYSKLKSMNIFDFFSNLGLDNGDKLEHCIKRMIRNKIGNKSITFIELYEKYGKNLIIPSVCLSSREIVYFSKETTPKLKLWKAIRMSLGVPFLFKPFIYKNNYYVDGGLKNNFPIELFNSVDTLGIDITSKKQDMNTIFNLEKFILSLVDVATRNKYTIIYQDVIQLSNFYVSNVNNNSDSQEKQEKKPEFEELLSFQPDISNETIRLSKEYAYSTIEKFFKDREEKIYNFCLDIVLDSIESFI